MSETEIDPRGAKCAACNQYMALRKNSEKWPIGGDLSSLPFHGFSAEASSASADALGTTAVGPYIFEGH